MHLKKFGARDFVARTLAPSVAPGKSSTSFSCGSGDQWVRARMLGDPAEAGAQS